MLHLPIVILAYFLNALAILIDKFLLVKQIPNPLIYVFYFSLFSLLILIFLPFVSKPNPSAFLLASLSTFTWTNGAYFMFKALARGQTSTVIPIIGALIPTLLLIFALFSRSIVIGEILAIILLIYGLICLTITDLTDKLVKSELIFTFLSALLFAASYLFLRQAYLSANFLSILVYSRIVLIPFGFLILVIPSTRKVIFNQSFKHPIFHLKSRVGLLFLIGAASGGTSELLITYSISLANPALVNSLQGTQYAFLFIAAILLSKRYPSIFKEKLTAVTLFSKVTGLALISLGIYILAFF